VVRICEYAQGAGRTTLGVGGSAGKHNTVNRVISTNTHNGGNSKQAIKWRRMIRGSRIWIKNVPLQDSSEDLGMH